MLFRVDKGYGNYPQNAAMNISVCLLENRLNYNLETVSIWESNLDWFNVQAFSRILFTIDDLIEHNNINLNYRT